VAQVAILFEFYYKQKTIPKKEMVLCEKNLPKICPKFPFLTKPLPAPATPDLPAIGLEPSGDWQAGHSDGRRGAHNVKNRF
jgi:hypothetical protein